MAAVAHLPAVRWSGHVTATLHELAALRDRLAAALCRCGWDEVDTFRVLVCADEAAANAMEHGSQAGDPIRAAFRVSSRNATVIFSDPCTTDGSLPHETHVPDEASEHGRGLILMRLFSDRLRTRLRPGQTIVAMTFNATADRGDQ